MVSEVKRAPIANFLKALLFLQPIQNIFCNLFPVFFTADEMTSSFKLFKITDAVFVFVGVCDFLRKGPWKDVVMSTTDEQDGIVRFLKINFGRTF